MDQHIVFKPAIFYASKLVFEKRDRKTSFLPNISFSNGKQRFYNSGLCFLYWILKQWEKRRTYYFIILVQNYIQVNMLEFRRMMFQMVKEPFLMKSIILSSRIVFQIMKFY